MNDYKLVITGSPGVGKHSTAIFLAEKMLGSKIIDINKIVVLGNAFLKHTNGRSTGEIDTLKTRKLLRKEVKWKGNLIIVGHIAPYVLKPYGIDLVAVLRRSPYSLLTTLEHRNYPQNKIKDNIASEILDICLYDAVKTFGIDKITEVDTTDINPEITAQIIISTLREKIKRETGIVDWLSLVHRNRDVHRFFEQSIGKIR